MIKRLKELLLLLKKDIFDARVNDKVITDWIYENLEGRFYYSDMLVPNHKNFIMQKCAAFEIRSEASYFCFMLESINQYQAF